MAPWGRRKGVRPTARFAIESVGGGGVTTATTPLFDAEVVDEADGAGAFARGEEGVFGCGVGGECGGGWRGGGGGAVVGLRGCGGWGDEEGC